MKKVKNQIFSLFFLILCNAFLLAEEDKSTITLKTPATPEYLSIFQKAYPDITFLSKYDEDKQDWKITMKIPTYPNKLRTINADLYWCDGSLLPESELKNKTQYWSLLYNYDYKQGLQDPSTYTPEQIAGMKKFGSDDNRMNGAGTPMFFFDIIYRGQKRVLVEEHIVSINFLGLKMNVHQRVRDNFLKVEKRIKEAAKTDKEVKDFVDSIAKNEAYYWRIIAGTNRKSFHSLGVAVDMRPKSYKGKEVFWGWTKEKDPENWMLTPLKNRWMPPDKVIDIFEEEGFIWGGKWGVWDNMHFEYHPELIEFAKLKQNNKS